MSLSKSSVNENGKKCNVKTEDSNAAVIASKSSNNLVVRINQDSDENLQALFDSVLNPSESRRPLQVPFRMRKLPDSFFNPPAASPKSPSVSHSRANSADSAYDCGSQPNINQTSVATSLSDLQTTTTQQATTTIAQPTPSSETQRLQICHSRAHSSPASLQQAYNLHGGNLSDNATTTYIQQQQQQQQTQADNSGRSVTGTNFSNDLVAFAAGTTTGTGINAANLIGLVNPSTSSGVVSATVGTHLSNYHMKQRSYDVISPIQLQNELGPLPPGWEQAKTNDGQIYYLNHTTKTTQWEDPRIQIKQQVINTAAANTRLANKTVNTAAILNGDLGPLPEGWEQAFTETGDVYFINHVDRTTSWDDPRIPILCQKLIKTKPEMNWISTIEMDKDNNVFKQKTILKPLNKPNVSLHMDPFLSGDNHARQESSDSGLSLSSNSFAVNNDFMNHMDNSMDCISENGSIIDNLDSTLQLNDSICMLNEVLNSPSTKPDNLEWYKLN